MENNNIQKEINENTNSRKDIIGRATASIDLYDFFERFSSQIEGLEEYIKNISNRLSNLEKAMQGGNQPNNEGQGGNQPNEEQEDPLDKPVQIQEPQMGQPNDPMAELLARQQEMQEMQAQQQ